MDSKYSRALVQSYREWNFILRKLNCRKRLIPSKRRGKITFLRTFSKDNRDEDEIVEGKNERM